MWVSIVFYYFFKWFKFTLKKIQFARNVLFTFQQGQFQINDFQADLDSNQKIKRAGVTQHLLPVREAAKETKLNMTQNEADICRDLMSLN